MTRTTKSLVFATMAMATLAAAAGDATLIRRKLEPSATENYKIETSAKLKMTNAALGDQDVTASSLESVVLKMGKLDATSESVDVEASRTTEKEDFQSSLPLEPPKKAKDLISKGKLDTRGRLNFEPSKTSDPMLAIFGGTNSLISDSLSIELPEKPVAIGDSWVMNLPKSALYPEDQKLSAKLVGEKQLDGQDVWVVAVTGTIKLKMDSGKQAASAPSDPNNPLAGMRVLVNGTVDVVTEGLVQKATGRTASITSKGNPKLSLELPDAGLKADVTGSIDSKTTLQK